MKLFTKLGLAAIMMSSIAVADYVPGKVDRIEDIAGTVKVAISRTDNHTVIKRNLPATSSKELLALLLTAMTTDKFVSCNVNGTVFDKCIVYNTQPQ